MGIPHAKRDGVVMARGKDERHNQNRKVGRDHPLMRELRQMREESKIYVADRERAIDERLRQRPKAETDED